MKKRHFSWIFDVFIGNFCRLLKIPADFVGKNSGQSQLLCSSGSMPTKSMAKISKILCGDKLDVGYL